jgi:hypothetical protein
VTRQLRKPERKECFIGLNNKNNENYGPLFPKKQAKNKPF